MGYIGKDPADSFISFVKQDFSVSATTSYTLDNAVTNQNEIALFINHVRQEPTTAYTASGTSLTLTSATASGDDMYCVYLGMAKQTVNAPDGSVGSSQVASTIITGQTAETSIATDDTVLIHDTSAGALRKMTRANFVSGVGGTNTPIFHANKNDGNQTIANTTATKVTFVNEVFDASSAYDASNSKFVAPSAGKYFLYSAVKWNNDDRGIRVIYLYKNGSLQIELFDQDGHDQGSQMASCGAILDLSASDYVEVYCYQSTADPENVVSSTTGTYFGGYKLIT
jgi:hypothetical protein